MRTTDDTTTAIAGGPDRRQQLVATAAQLFDERGYYQTSVEDVAEACGIRKPTLYHYFSGKDEILFSIHDEFIDLLIARQRARDEQGVPPGDALQALMADVLGLMSTHRGYVRVFFEHYRELNGEARAAIKRKRDDYQASIEALFRRGAETGEFRAVDPTLATLTLAGMCNWAYHWYDPTGPLSSDDIASAFRQILRDGFEKDVER